MLRCDPASHRPLYLLGALTHVYVRGMVEPLVVNEVPAARALLERAGLPGAVAGIARYLRWQPDGAWRIVDDGALVAMVTLLRFGAVGFVGCMAVDASHQGRGLGRRLLEHAHGAGRRAGVTTFLLEATPSGQPVYERLGYVDEHETWNLGRPAREPGATDPAPDGLQDLSAARSEILALDQRATGSSRDAMIGDLITAHRGALVRTSDLAAYGLVVDTRVGPVIARDPGAGRAVIDRLATSGASLASVPAANEPAIAAFTAHGFTVWRTLRRMRLGPPVATPAHWLWALASPGAG